MKRHEAGIKSHKIAHPEETRPLAGGIEMQGTVYVNRPPEICYAYWRDLEHLPHFMEHVESVEVIDNIRSHWLVTAPGDTTAEWDAEIIEDIADERIAWQSMPGSQINNVGSVRFSPRADGRQTEVQVAMTYKPPFGILGNAFVKLFGESPEEQLQDDLTKFKEVVERED